jgi:hypothetical protein
VGHLNAAPRVKKSPGTRAACAGANHIGDNAFASTSSMKARSGDSRVTLCVTDLPSAITHKATPYSFRSLASSPAALVTSPDASPPRRVGAPTCCIWRLSQIKSLGRGVTSSQYLRKAASRESVTHVTVRRSVPPSLVGYPKRGQITVLPPGRLLSGIPRALRR